MSWYKRGEGRDRVNNVTFSISALMSSLERLDSNLSVGGGETLAFLCSNIATENIKEN